MDKVVTAPGIIDTTYEVIDSYFLPEVAEEAIHFRWPTEQQYIDKITARIAELRAIPPKERSREMVAFGGVLIAFEQQGVLESSQICEITEAVYGIGSVAQTYEAAHQPSAHNDNETAVARKIDDCYQTVGMIIRCLNVVK